MRKNSIDKPCQNCGKIFSVQAYRAAKALFCSRECLWAGRKPRKVKPPVGMICRHCGAAYHVPDHRADKTTYCSKRCTALACLPKHAEKRVKNLRERPRVLLDPEIRKARKRVSDSAHHAKNRDKALERGAAYYIANKEKLKAQNKAWTAKNAERVTKLKRKKREQDGERIRANRRQHYRDNKAVYVANARKRESHIARATPAWADLKAIEAFYVEADRLTRETGIKHHVDHIFPLQGKTMCGLHVEDNLQVIPAIVNLRKSNFV